MSGAHTFPPKPRILVITMRRLGDVLLTTPLVHALRRGIPGARVDVLVFRGTEGMLAGNPDIDRVIAIAERPSAVAMTRLIGQLWRRYDLAVSTQTGDRPTFLAAIAGRFRVGLVPKNAAGWKRLALNLCVTAEPDLHRVHELQRMAGALGIDVLPEIGLPKSQAPPIARPRYAVLHANPMYRIRRWTDSGWRALAQALHERGLKVVVTGGPSADERDYLDRLWDPVRPGVPAVRVKELRDAFDATLKDPEFIKAASAARIEINPITGVALQDPVRKVLATPKNLADRAKAIIAE